MVEIARIEQIITDGSTASKGKFINQYPNITRYKSPQENTSTWNHAEQNVFGRIANQIDNVYADKSSVEGEVYLLVEQEVCSSCRQGLENSNTSAGIVKQFSDEYPNITIIIYNLRKINEVLIIRGGKRMQ